MPRKQTWPPRVHSRGGVDSIRVSLPGGGQRKYTLGPSGSEQARSEYVRVVAELEHDRVSALKGRGGLAVAELIAPFLDRCAREVDPRQVARVEAAVRPLFELYGHTSAADFGPVALEVVRARYVADGYSRGVCNSMASVVRQMFKWAASRELLPLDVYARLATLGPLLSGKTDAPDPPEVRPVPAADVERTLPHLSAIVGDMVRLQLLTGCRPGELVVMRPCDVVRPWRTFEAGPAWLYHLENHKTRWKGGRRDVAIGPRAQAILMPYLERRPEAFCFSPAEATAARRAAQRLARKTLVQPSQASRKKAEPKKKPGERYTTESYAGAIERAAKKAGVAHWAPNQLRHVVGTRVRADYSREDAQAVLGHSSPSTTDIYAQACERAGRIAARDG